MPAAGDCFVGECLAGFCREVVLGGTWAGQAASELFSGGLLHGGE